MPFSTHQKHKVKRDQLGEHVGMSIPVQITLPTSDLSIDKLIEMRRHFRMASEYAGDPESSCSIPDAHQGWLNVLSGYRSSKLYEFHKKFDELEHEKEENWERTYYAFNLSELPPCVTHSILNPEPHLKRPTNIRTIAAILSKKGWDYKHIAGFFYSHYKNLSDFSPNKYNAETAADFWGRVYWALKISGLGRGCNCANRCD